MAREPEDIAAHDLSSGEFGPLDFLYDPLGMLRRRWLAVLAALLIGLSATALFTLSRPVLYAARAEVRVASQKISEDLVKSTTQEDTVERVDALMSEALSMSNLKGVVEKNNLYPQRGQAITLDEVKALMPARITVETVQSLSGPPSRGRQPGAVLLAITFRARAPEQAANVANDIAGLFVATGVRTRMEQNRLTTQFLHRELGEAGEALRDVTRRISEFQQAHRGELPDQLDSTLRQLESLRQQRQALTMQIADVETRVAMAAVQMPGDSPQSRLEEMRSTLGQQLAVHTEEHPNVVALRRQIGLLEEEIEGRDPAAPLRDHGYLEEVGQREIARLRAELALTERMIIEVDARVANTPARAEKLSALEQERTVLAETHLELMRKVQDAQLAESLELAQQGERVAILSRAVPPSAPEGSRWKYVLAGSAASLGLALGLGLFLEWRDPILASLPGFEAASGLPVLGSVPRIS